MRISKSLEGILRKERTRRHTVNNSQCHSGIRVHVDECAEAYDILGWPIIDLGFLSGSEKATDVTAWEA